jgi:flagellin-like hook-associated protein FlgL
MIFKPALWYPIAVGLTVLNVLGVVAFASQPWHATAHGVLALGFGVWAQRLRKTAGGSQVQDGSQANDVQDRLEALDAEVDRLRQELGEAQERLDFAERLLAQKREPRGVGPEH